MIAALQACVSRGYRKRARARRVCRDAPAARFPVGKRGGMEEPEATSQRCRRKANRRFDFEPYSRPRSKRFQGIRSHPRSAGGDGGRDQGFQGRHHVGDRAMTKPDTPFPKHWRYYIFIKWAADHRRARAGAETVRRVVMRWDRHCPNPRCGRSCRGAPVLAAIFVAAIEEMTGDDYSEAQQQAGPAPPMMKRNSAGGWPVNSR